MKLKISRQQLIAALRTVNAAISTRTTFPILGYFILRARPGALEITASNLDITISTTIEADVELQGDAALPQRFSGMISDMSGEEIELALDDRFVASIRCGQIFYKIHGLDPKEFPPISQPTGNRKFTMPQSRLKGILRRALVAVAMQDEERPSLTGVLFKFTGKQVEIVASDGRRLAHETMEVKGDFGDGSFIVPHKTVTELAKSLKNEGAIEVHCDPEKMIKFTLMDDNDGVTVITAQVMAIQYIAYEKPLAAWDKERHRIMLNREEFIAVLKRAAHIIFEKAAAVYFTFTKNNLAVTTQVAGLGESRENVAVLYDGDEVKLAFNPNYILEALNIFDTEMVVMEFSDRHSPMVLRIEGPAFRYFVIGLKQS